MQSIANIVLLIPTNEKFFSNLWKQNVLVHITLIDSPVKKRQQIF